MNLNYNYGSRIQQKQFSFVGCLVFCLIISAFANGEDFEGGAPGWTIDSPVVWEIGIPTGSSGPDLAHSGLKCTGTNINGNYPNSANSKLISPTWSIPNDRPRLRFWHWFATEEQFDWGSVLVSTNNGSTWDTLRQFGGRYSGRSEGWTKSMILLDNYRGKQVKVAFFFHSDFSTTNDGWYIDDVIVESGPFASPADSEVIFLNSEDYGAWTIDNGREWEIGMPVGSHGPDQAHSGNYCIGTDLDNVYSNMADSKFVSPPFVVPQANPRLRFWHWFEIEYPFDWGRVLATTNNGTSWDTLRLFGGPFSGTSEGWTRALVDLSPYSGQDVRVAFCFHSDVSTARDGWYLDDISVESGEYLTPAIATNSFADPNDYGDWTIDNGREWEIGIPVGTRGPESTISKPYCIGTDLDNVYEPNANSRFVSPPIDLSSGSNSAVLSFYQWFEFADFGDSGCVQVSTNNGVSWQRVSGSTVFGARRTWERQQLDVSQFAGRTIRLAFLMSSNASGQADGWYIDDIFLDTRLDVKLINNDALPVGYALLQNSPNPFNPETIIEFALSHREHVIIEVLNILGQKLKTLVDQDLQPGAYQTTWDGTDSHGLKAASGVYFYRMAAGSFVDTKKMILMK